MKLVVLSIAAIAFLPTIFLAGAFPQHSKIEVSADLTCLKSYVKQGKECVKTIYEHPISRCPPGFEPTNKHPQTTASSHIPSSSSSQFAARHSRKKGTAVSGKNIFDCSRIVTAPAHPYCPVEFAGERSQDGTQVCVKYYEEEAKRYCLNGFSLRHDGCYRTTVIEPSLSCGDHLFYMVGNQCQRVVEMPAMEGCGEGFLPDGGKCVRIERQPVIEVCPTGSLPVNQTCVDRRVVPAKGNCPPTQTVTADGCMSTIVLMADLKCQGDSVAAGNNCVQEHIADAALRCDDGWSLQADGFCYAKKDPVPYCTDGVLVPSTQQCQKTEAILADFTCPPGFELRGVDQCVQPNVRPMQWTCAPGYTLQGSQCVLEVVQPSYRQCPESFLLVENTCMRPTYAPKWKKCQKGFNLVGGHCTSVQEMQPDMTCPHGFILRGNKCVEDRRSDIELSCHGDAELRDGVCVVKMVAPSKNKCQKPYVHNPQTGICEDEEIVPAENVCPDGYQLNGDCQRTETIPPIAKCPDNYYYDKHYHNCKPNQKYIPITTTQTHSKMSFNDGSIPISTSVGRKDLTYHQNNYYPLSQPHSQYSVL